MALSEGVEWAAHALALLSVLPEGATLSASALAEFHGLPKAYLAKLMQTLARSGLVTASRGARGGYALARAATGVTLWDVRAALEGEGPEFRCQNIRNRGPCAAGRPDPAPCAIAKAYWAAERAYRESLEAVTISDIARAAAAGADAEKASRVLAWLGAATRPA